ncbi:inhibitory POU protein isoform X2 [Hyalella azteca]|uniref:POU domain protein n=1 Tax=Hyalella azteca TaxID=294128 RepID=A0A979FS75_HYAAZ|nr:inhibitory POU protein isoform X2 [Hyalella azteca]
MLASPPSVSSPLNLHHQDGSGMYSPDKMMASAAAVSAAKGVSANGGFHSGRYSPSFRSPDPRRCNTQEWSGYPVSLQFSSMLLPYQKAGYGGSYQDHSRQSNEQEDYKPLPLGPQGQLFGGGGLDELSRADLADKHQTPGVGALKPPDMMYHPGMASTPHTPPSRPPQMGHHSMEGLEMLDPINSSAMTTLTPMSDGGMMHGGVYSHSPMNSMMGHPGLPHPHMPLSYLPSMHDTDTDPRELEAFSERFKQRRIKLGVTQADVGKALANLKLPGVGALSQSTICRFESLTLSHNNMIALKPVLQAWLEEAEAQMRNKRRDPDAPSVLPMGEKRKRTSIAAPEKRSLEAYFAVQPRPSGEKIAAIAEKLDLKKNVVRVWFCNQRQKQKRMKFAATQKHMSNGPSGGMQHPVMGGMMGPHSHLPPHTPVP